MNRNFHYNFDDVPALYIDPGMKNFVAGVWRTVDKETKQVSYQPLRITGHYYHERTGLNHLRDRQEINGAPEALSWAGRTSVDKARDRRLVEEGKRQLFHEALASFRLFADRHGDGRDFVTVIEHGYDGASGSHHRKPACHEFQLFLAQFVLVGTTSGYNTSQCCSRCGNRLQYAKPKEEIRSKVCQSKACMKTIKGKLRAFHVDRDINAAVNFALIDEAGARGGESPVRFQSKSYKKRSLSTPPA